MDFSCTTHHEVTVSAKSDLIGSSTQEALDTLRGTIIPIWVAQMCNAKHKLRSIR